MYLFLAICMLYLLGPGAIKESPVRMRVGPAAALAQQEHLHDWHSRGTRGLEVLPGLETGASRELLQRGPCLRTLLA